VSADLVHDASTTGAVRQRPGRPGGRRPHHGREARLAIAFLAPALIALLVLRVWPMLSAIVTSLNTPHAESFIPTFGNFAFITSDPGFWVMVRVTLLFTVIVNPLQILVSLALAVLLTQRLKGARAWRILIFLPAAVPQTVSAIVWGIAMGPAGPLNGALARLGIPTQPFLSGKSESLLSIILIVSWIGVGYWMMFLIAGLLDIPTMYSEAAAIDGAGWWRTFWYVIIPQLRRPLGFVLVADTVANFLVFAPVQILTQGGPEGSTNLVMFEIYNRAYQYNDLGSAAAETVMLVIVVLLIVAVQFRFLPGKND
jgi:multiple sugar transport system permease protein